ncbi:uncharacterized protein PAC_01939 [Phialocephala subalpina]|uniref:Sfi1 spindle body domain-containing protein n=1 Tax=Phialocephala subalpina TaxID=576137 RepID=A0A1L7WH16_9HELO|nr:uncharacterized protein PAC_01939 [Phialocephala subalpina]
MPPPGSHQLSNVGQSAEHADLYYSNDDVAILHDIVVLAQELLPTLPERERLPTNALFSAYYDILPRVGINADHDSRYARVLFKIGGLRSQGTLYEKFEEILSRMGIEIEFDNEDVEEHNSQIEDSQTEQDLLTTGETSPQDENKYTQSRPRRNSESSFWDLGNGIQPKSKLRRNSFASLGPNRASGESEKSVLQERGPAAQQPKANGVGGSKDNQGNDNVRARLSPRTEKPRRGRGRSVSTHGSMRIRRRSRSSAVVPPNPAYASSDEYQAASEFTAATTDFGEEAPAKLPKSLQPASRHEAGALMQIRASVIQQHYTALLAKRQLRKWRDKASKTREHNASLELVALIHDRKALLHSAFDAWRQCYVEERQIKETRLFFEHLEQRAKRARDIFLLHLAFTHWLARTYEQVQRTALARRHLIRARIFNAWKEITAVNELKVRRQVLKRFFAAWKRQYSATSEASAAAVQVYESNLVEKIYKQWVHRLWDIQATNWWAGRLARRTLFQWIVATHNHWENNRTAEETRHLELSWNAWRTWRAKAEKHLRMSQEASDYYKNQLCRGIIRRWRHETRVIPVRETLQTDVSVRLLRGTFGTWLKRTRQEKQAATVDRTKMLKEALTLWRHKARSQVLITQINHRVLAQTSYSWLLASREKYVQRMLRERRLRECLRVWKYRQQVSTEQRLEQEDIALSFRARRSENLVLRQWYLRMETLQRNETTAIDFYAPRLARGIMTQWSGKVKHVQQLERWSQDAKFYFVASKSLKLWKAYTESTKRDKRKAAYAQVRRSVKMNIARRALKTWQSKAQHLLDLRAQALDIDQNKNVIIAMYNFDRWRAHTEELSELESLARENALKKQFTTWKRRWEALQALSTEATIAYQEHRQSRALKKWNLSALQLRSQANYALDIREKNAKRNFRKMLLYWHQKAAATRPTKRVEMLKSVHFGTSNAEAWSEAEEGLEVEEWAKGLDEVVVLSTPLPGYLSTPSKRSERVMAAAARFSTTPKAPLSTPFERQLRAQYSGGLLPSHRKPLGRSTLGIGGGFADIPESSTNNDQGSSHGA